MDNNTAIRVEGLRKNYPIYKNKNDRLKEALSLKRRKYHEVFFALDNLNFEIRKGETIGIIGQNGSGKSTLLKILTGVLSPTSGKVEVNGKISALLELGAGFNPEMTGLENIYLNGTIMGYTTAEIDQKVPQIIEFADIGVFVDQPVKMYSSGMFARLAFAVAINVEPEILIVDEALSVGDMRFQIKCMDHMKKMMEGGTTVLFVSHDIGAVRRFCSSTIWINKGKIECHDETNAVCDRYMQFLKIGETDTELPNEVEIGAIPEFKEGNNIAEIVDFSVFDGRGNKINSIKYDEYVNVIVTYDVYDENIVNPVLGVALYSIEDEYLCGLNTLLDKKTIPWKYGRNKYRIEYPQGLTAIGGKYYFTTALFEQTATVPIQFLSRIKEIEVFSGYVSEGKYIIPHKWSEFYE